MLEANNNINNYKARNYTAKIIELNRSLIGQNLSQSIKVFHHKSNNIVGLNSKFSSKNSDKNILKKSIGPTTKKDSKITKNIFSRKKKLLLNNSDYSIKQNYKKIKTKNKNSFIKLKEEIKVFKPNFCNREDSFLSLNISKKHNSYTNIFLNKKFLSIDQNNNNNATRRESNKNKLIKEIENVKFRIALLNNKLVNSTKKYLYFKLINNKRKNSENIVLLKNKINTEKINYEKEIFWHKLKLFKIMENSISINKLKEDIQKEELLFKKRKCLLIQKIMELNILIFQNKNNIKNNSDSEIEISSSFCYDNDIDDMSTDEMLITKNKNISKINHFSPSNYK